MALPEDLTYVTVVGQVAEVTDGAARTVVFRTPEWLQGRPFIRPFGLAATVDVDGVFAIELPATDDPAFSPINWAYDVTIQAGSQYYYGTLEVPTATVGSIELSAAMNSGVPSDAGTVSYLLTSTRSVAGGVAALDVDGDVVDAAGNKITGGGGGGGPSPANTVTSETSYGQSADDGAATTYSRGDHTHGTPAVVTYATLSGKPASFTPALHASSHTDGGADEVSLDGSQVTSGTVAFVRLPTGTSSATVAIGDHTHGGGGGGITPGFASGYRTAGSLAGTAIGASWEVVTGFTMAIAAVTGDRIAFQVSGLIDHNSSRTDIYDLAVVVSGAAVRYAATGTVTPGTDGAPEQSNSTVQYGPGVLSFAFTAVSGDISGGNVSVAIAHKGPGTGSFLASAAYPLRWHAVNYKQ